MSTESSARCSASVRVWGERWGMGAPRSPKGAVVSGRHQACGRRSPAWGYRPPAPEAGHMVEGLT